MADIDFDRKSGRPRVATAALAAFGRDDARFRRLRNLRRCVVVLPIFTGIIFALTHGAWPAFKAFGFGVSAPPRPGIRSRKSSARFRRSTARSSPRRSRCSSPCPVGIGIAIFLTEICPRPLRRPVGIAIELLAGIPSIIYGIWGLFIFAPFFQRTSQPWMIDRFRQHSLPAGSLRRAALRHRHLHGVAHSFDHDPAVHFGGDARCLRDRSADPEGSCLWPGLHDLGSDVARRAAFRAHRRRRRRDAGARPRAWRNDGGDLRDRQCAPHQSRRFFAPGTTISATIANEFTEAVGDLYLSSLIAIGLILFFITFIVLAAAQLMLRASITLGPEGARK